MTIKDLYNILEAEVDAGNLTLDSEIIVVAKYSVMFEVFCLFSKW